MLDDPAPKPVPEFPRLRREIVIRERVFFGDDDTGYGWMNVRRKDTRTSAYSPVWLPAAAPGWVAPVAHPAALRTSAINPRVAGMKTASERVSQWTPMRR